MQVECPIFSLLLIERHRRGALLVDDDEPIDSNCCTGRGLVQERELLAGRCAINVALRTSSPAGTPSGMTTSN